MAILREAERGVDQQGLFCKHGICEQTFCRWERLYGGLGISEVQIYYTPKLFVHHLVPTRKMSLVWIVRQRFASGRDTCRIFEVDRLRPYPKSKLIVRAIWALFVLLSKSVGGLFWRNRSQYPYLQNYFYEVGLVPIQNLGWIYEQYRQRVQSERSN